MTEKKEDIKPPYCIERRSFDPEILNFTLKNMQISIDNLNNKSDKKFQELHGIVKSIYKEMKQSNSEQVRIDKEFSICRASHQASEQSTDSTHKKRNNLLFHILSIISAFGALFISLFAYFKKGGH